MKKVVLRGAAAAAVSFVFTQAAFAQRADENAVTSAEDAFGTRVGNDNVGLYDSRSARGFDPQQAGNIRVEGLYFDQQAMFGQRLQRSQSMRIGLSAQSYPFPAPTGIADTSMIKPGDKPFATASVNFGYPIGMRNIVVDFGAPLIGEKLGMAGGINLFPGRTDWGGRFRGVTGALLLNFKPNDNIELIPFYYNNHSFHNTVQPSIFTAGNYLPPRIDRDVFYGQWWADREQNEINAGLIARGNLGSNWRLQSGLFRSDQSRNKNFSVLFRNTQPNGAANLDVIAFGKNRSNSTSGEVRASGIFTQGVYRHTVHLAVRGRDVTRTFGGGRTLSLGTAMIGVDAPVAEPAFTTLPRDRDLVRQIMPGVSYVGQWAGVGEFSAGLQKVYYRRDTGKENTAFIRTKSEPWLYNGTVAIYATKALSFYAGYTRGLEEFGTAPDNALNSGEPMPAGLTSQIDGGLRYQIKPGLSVMAGVFEVKKPYFDRDPANIYTGVGNLSHRGVEMSLTGNVFPGFTVVAGAYFLKARVTGSSVDRGLIGEVPPGVPPHLIRINFQYGPASWNGFALDTLIEETASHNANRLNTFRMPAIVTVDLGARYNFTVAGTTANLRVQLRNVANKFGWSVETSSGRFTPIQQRRVQVRLAADF